MLPTLEQLLASPVASVRGTLCRRLVPFSESLPAACTTQLLVCLERETHPKVLQRLLQLLWKLPLTSCDAARLWEGALAVEERTALPQVCSTVSVCYKLSPSFVCSCWYPSRAGAPCSTGVPGSHVWRPVHHHNPTPRGTHD